MNILGVLLFCGSFVVYSPLFERLLAKVFTLFLGGFTKKGQ